MYIYVCSKKKSIAMKSHNLAICNLGKLQLLVKLEEMRALVVMGVVGGVAVDEGGETTWK